MRLSTVCAATKPYLTVLKKPVKYWTVCLAYAPQVEPSHLCQVLVLIVGRDAAQEVDVLCKGTGSSAIQRSFAMHACW